MNRSLEFKDGLLICSRPHANLGEDLLHIVVNEEEVFYLAVAFAKVTRHLLFGVFIIHKRLGFILIHTFVHVLKEDGLDRFSALKVSFILLTKQGNVLAVYVISWLEFLAPLLVVPLLKQNVVINRQMCEESAEAFEV